MCNNNASSGEISAMSVHNNSSHQGGGGGGSHMNSTQMPRNSLGGSFNQRQQGTVEKLLVGFET